MCSTTVQLVYCSDIGKSYWQQLHGMRDGTHKSLTGHLMDLTTMKSNKIE
jgi:hypothetical protein